MTIRELMDILTGMAPEADAFVQLFKTDGTSESFEIEAVHRALDRPHREAPL